jgi:hypothetical protein
MDPSLNRYRLSDTLFTTIRSSVEIDAQSERKVVLYTEFGVVRGKVSASAFGDSNRMLDSNLENMSRVIIEPDILELEDATIEHYSNHLPTASFDRLFVRLEGVQGFAIGSNEVRRA